MKKRNEVELNDQWDLSTLYPSMQAWEADLKKEIPNPQADCKWPQLRLFAGKLAQGPETLQQFLTLLLETERKLSKLYTYAHLKHDEDIADEAAKKAYEQISMLFHGFGEETSWFPPELLGLKEEKLKELMSSPLLAPYQFYLEKMIRMKPHTLSPGEERLMSMAGMSLAAPHKTFSAINDADFKFPAATDGKGTLRPISHATYSLYIRDPDRNLRKSAFEVYHRQYLAYENSLCELLSGEVQTHQFSAKARGYCSCLQAALYPKNIDPAVYHSLIESVHQGLKSLHRYMELRKKILKVEELHLYDIYTPLTPSLDIKLSYEEAKQWVIESVAPLGREYQDLLKRGLEKDRWVDRYENENKRSGAYSSGCFDSMPYILMNYKTLLKDVFTLAHEAGHSMHSLYSRSHQPYQYSDYSIFLAEVASTFNEELLSRWLLPQFKSREEKIFLINQKIEDIRGTLFRQTMFAEFELFIHEQIERGAPLTPALLKNHYRQLNERYFGPSVVIDPEIEIEWARIPHFYYNFYVFQYATGISAALALVEKVTKGDEHDREAYLSFLKGGSSLYPIDMLKRAGIDMTSKAPVQAAIETFDRLLTELETLLDLSK